MCCRLAESGQHSGLTRSQDCSYPLRLRNIPFLLEFAGLPGLGPRLRVDFNCGLCFGGLVRIRIQNSTSLPSLRAQYGSMKIEGKGHVNIARNKHVESVSTRCLKELPGMLHGFGELLRFQRVQNVLSCEPCPASLQDSKADLLHVRGVVGVGIDDDLYPMLLSLP